MGVEDLWRDLGYFGMRRNNFGHMVENKIIHFMLFL